VAEVKVKRLGLAAYMKLNGAQFRGHSPLPNFKGNFLFDTDKSLKEWEVEYLNSCCSKHDSEVMTLRKFINVGGS